MEYLSRGWLPVGHIVVNLCRIEGYRGRKWLANRSRWNTSSWWFREINSSTVTNDSILCMDGRVSKEDKGRERRLVGEVIVESPSKQ